jgi:hypothetical protein
MTVPNPKALALVAALALAAATFGLSACGYSSDSKEVSEGETVKLGALRYNVIFSRYLNPNDSEDAAYLVGQPAPAPDSTYFGVFFEVQNESDEPQTLPKALTITDTNHQVFDAIASESLYALPFGGEVEAEEQVPVLDSTPQQGAIEGSLVLFELPDSASQSRPLTLEVPGPEGPARIVLDL